MKNNVYMRIHLTDNSEYDVVDELIEQKFPEADLWPAEREVRFAGTAERSQELLRAIEAVAEHDKVFTTAR